MELIGMELIGIEDIGMLDIGDALTAVPRGAWLRSMLPIGVAATAPSVVALLASNDCGNPFTLRLFAPTRTVGATETSTNGCGPTGGATPDMSYWWTAPTWAVLPRGVPGAPISAPPLAGQLVTARPNPLPDVGLGWVSAPYSDQVPLPSPLTLAT